MSDQARTWTESTLYRDLSRYAVPQRERQIAIVVDRVARAAATGDVLEICCGEHLDWLRAAGHVEVDLHWMTAGQMILSAVRP